MNKNLNKIVDEILSNYKRDLIEIESLELDINMLKNNYDTMGSISYEEKVKSNSTSSKVENEVIKRESELQQLENKLDKIVYRNSKVRNALKLLGEREQEFIQYFYIKGLTYSKVSIVMDMGNKYIYDYKKKITDKLVVIFRDFNML